MDRAAEIDGLAATADLTEDRIAQVESLPPRPTFPVWAVRPARSPPVSFTTARTARRKVHYRHDRSSHCSRRHRAPRFLPIGRFGRDGFGQGRADRCAVESRSCRPDTFEIMRREGTEVPFSSKLDYEKRPGTYSCAGCDLALYSSKTKFDSGTGWPSFWAPLPHAVETKIDRLAARRAQRSALPPLRRASRPRVRRWSAADRKALLHGRRRAALQAGRAGVARGAANHNSQVTFIFGNKTSSCSGTFFGHDETLSLHRRRHRARRRRLSGNRERAKCADDRGERIARDVRSAADRAGRTRLRFRCVACSNSSAHRSWFANGPNQRDARRHRPCR